MDKVFTNNCVGCHSGSGGNKGGVNLETYASTKRWIKEIGDEVAGKKMPPSKKPPLSDDQIRLVNIWVTAGAAEVAVDPTAPPVVTAPTPVVQIPSDPKEITFSMVKSILLEPRCFKCHADPTNKGKVNLETYANVKANLQDMYDDIKDGSMPKGNDKVLTDDQLKIFFDWFDAGALENGVVVEKKLDHVDP
jgi:uncharacterized membrane protein